MSLFWSLWITILSLGCWLWILYWLVGVLGYKPHMEEDGTTGHEYDGVREYDRPLPKWWLIVFFGTMAWGLLYFVLYPSIVPHAWKGITTVEINGKQEPWTSENELLSDLEKNNKVFINTFNDKILQDPAVTKQLANLEKLQAEQRKNAEPNADLKAQIDKELAALAPAVQKLSQDPQAVKIGQRLFLQNCSVCHGSQAHGAAGYPNLTDNDWLYGGTPDKLVLTLHNGRIGAMPEWKTQIGEEGVRAAAEYVLSLSPGHGSKANGELNQTLVTQGKAIFETNCTVCHGANAKGNIEVGAPNLTDDIWLYGGDREAVRTTLRNGRAGVMPHWDIKLGNERIMLLASYVYSLGGGQTAQPVPSTATATASTAK
ncbi:cytochrome-c oxidase, cbb3-type subunit III [Faucicola boevrei]|uniref:cytochrome-c oxidase, cbb3-type subunit III n=1 Tax=Faucicola boevrei TaxID=346665 RepID=UPI0003748D55|nr:cytochrome-c oxidase, cbb3-type subunit III [Moraxella boevrei]